MRSPTILIVDDDAMIRKTCRLMLARKGCNVLEAGSGETACDVFASQHVDLVILDLNMPGMSGEETLTALRELDKTVKVVIASGNETEVSTPTGERPDGYLKKPFGMKDLYTIADTHLGIG